MVCFGHEAMVRIGIAAVDGVVAAAAADCQCSGRCQPARLLPSKRRSSLHADARNGADRLRHADDRSAGFVPPVEVYGQSRGRCCRHGPSVTLFKARFHGRRCRPRPVLPLRTTCTNSFRSCPSHGSFLHAYFPGLDVSRSRSIAHRIACSFFRTRSSPSAWV